MSILQRNTGYCIQHGPVRSSAASAEVLLTIFSPANWKPRPSVMMCDLWPSGEAGCASFASSTVSLAPCRSLSGSDRHIISSQPQSTGTSSACDVVARCLADPLHPMRAPHKCIPRIPSPQCMPCTFLPFANSDVHGNSLRVRAEWITHGCCCPASTDPRAEGPVTVCLAGPWEMSRIPRR